jgi:hypothetical protein
MSHFAKVENNIVTQVIVAEQDVIDSGLFGDPKSWIQTSYNTRGGVHYGQDGKPDGGIALRGTFAGIGYSYDAVKDIFIAPVIELPDVLPPLNPTTIETITLNTASSTITL